MRPQKILVGNGLRREVQGDVSCTPTRDGQRRSAPAVRRGQRMQVAQLKVEREQVLRAHHPLPAAAQRLRREQLAQLHAFNDVGPQGQLLKEGGRRELASPGEPQGTISVGVRIACRTGFHPGVRQRGTRSTMNHDHSSPFSTTPTRLNRNFNRTGLIFVNRFTSIKAKPCPMMFEPERRLYFQAGMSLKR